MRALRLPLRAMPGKERPNDCSRSNRVVCCGACAEPSNGTTRRAFMLTTTAMASGLVQLAGCAQAQTSFLPSGDATEGEIGVKQLDGKLAAALTASVYLAVQNLQILPEAQFQAEVFKLRQREFKYYYEAFKEQLPAVPDLTDNGGAITNPVYFNFIYYILWKVVAMNVADPAQRACVVLEAGRELAKLVAQDALELAATSAQQGQGRASPRDLLHALHLALLHFQDGNYFREYALVWGGGQAVQPDWVIIADTRTTKAAPAGESAAEPATVVDSAGAAEDVHSVGCSETGGEGDCGGEGEAEGDAREVGGGVETAGAPVGEMMGMATSDVVDDVVFQLRVTGVVDVNGAVALRLEENGFWGAPLFGLLACITHTAGYPNWEVQEYLLKDEFKPPDYYIFVDPLYVIPTLPPSTPQPKVLLQNWSPASLR